MARVDDLLAQWSDEELDAVWRWSGFGEDFDPAPGQRPAARSAMLRGTARAPQDVVTGRTRRKLMLLAMLRPMTRRARADLARLFASMAPGHARVAAAALFRKLHPHPRPVVRRLSSVVVWLCPQVGHGVLAPTRGSPLAAFALPTPGVPPT
jgi:hypothetical protein